MPELPEVESIKIQLHKYLVGHTIEKVNVVHKKIFTGDPTTIENGKIKNVRRFGKVLVIDLTNRHSMVIHIKLTGQLIYRGPKLRGVQRLSEKVVDGLGGKHTHVIFELDREGKLYYNDVRKFGYIKVIKSKEVKNIDFLKKLGPEPLDTLTLKKFSEALSGTRRVVKVVIMDQSKIAGIGNIYANDALFLAKIDPKRKANSLDGGEIKKLFRAIETVLKKGLKYGGASEMSYVTPDGQDGEYQDHTLVYGQEGSVCKHGCGGRVKKFKLAGRGTFWCPECQR